MTNYKHDEMLEAINEMNEVRDFEDLDDALGVFTYDEILDYYFSYLGYINAYRLFKSTFCEFYNIEPKTENELEIY